MLFYLCSIDSHFALSPDTVVFGYSLYPFDYNDYNNNNNYNDYRDRNRDRTGDKNRDRDIKIDNQRG